MHFRSHIKVCFSDIDNAGIVYYPRFMHYFHLAMEDFFSSVLSVDYSNVLHERNLSCPTVHVECNFKRRLKYGDRIEMEVSILKTGQSSITWGYRGFLHDGSDIVVEGHNITVCVRTDTFEKIDIPDWLKKGLTDYMDSF
jgi:4-hydroxybenzoyl-CoA thioesterase